VTAIRRMMTAINMTKRKTTNWKNEKKRLTRMQGKERNNDKMAMTKTREEEKKNKPVLWYAVRPHFRAQALYYIKWVEISSSHCLNRVASGNSHKMNYED